VDTGLDQSNSNWGSTFLVLETVHAGHNLSLL
jgi:hypothetical protein